MIAGLGPDYLDATLLRGALAFGEFDTKPSWIPTEYPIRPIADMSAIVSGSDEDSWNMSGEPDVGRHYGVSYLIDANVVQSSPIDSAIALYELGRSTYALDAFTHPLIEKVMADDIDAVDAMLRAVSRRIFECGALDNPTRISRDLLELEMWLAAVTLTKKLRGSLQEREPLLEMLRNVVRASDHVDKELLLRAIN
jgi:hypothetical protein